MILNLTRTNVLISPFLSIYITYLHVLFNFEYVTFEAKALFYYYFAKYVFSINFFSFSWAPTKLAVLI